MPQRYLRRFTEPDEVIEAPLLQSRLVTMGGLTVSLDAHQPGWRWSEHLRPLMGTEWCQAHHLGIVLAGRLGIRMQDGTELEIGPRELLDVPPGHDGWTVGDEPLLVLAWSGAKAWLARLDALTERVLATVLFVDIVDSTATASRLGERAWSDLLGRFERQSREEVARYRGRVVKSTGDGLLALFDGAARALRAAVALRVVAHDLNVALRGAVHTGEIALVDDDVEGLVVHEASRMMALAAPGQIVVSAATVGLTGESGLTFEDLGEHPLRGIEGQRRLYAVA